MAPNARLVSPTGRATTILCLCCHILLPNQLGSTAVNVADAFLPRSQSRQQRLLADDNAVSGGGGEQRNRVLLRRPPSLSELFGTADGPDEDDTNGESGSGGGTTTKNQKQKGGSSPVSSFEEVMRKMTNNPDYRFGDMTKSAVGAGTHAIEDAVHKATGKDDYHFGVSFGFLACALFCIVSSRVCSN